jgi:1-acyl-sn-glycerol-3-phosphate acyltransferase
MHHMRRARAIGRIRDLGMTVIRVIQRILLLTLQVMLGMLLTPLVLSGRTGSGLNTNSCVTSWWHNRVADILGIRITVSGPRPKAPALLVSNHVSWLDIVVLGGLTHADFLSKYEVRKWPVIGWLAARSGTLFIRRGSHEAAAVNEQIAQRLKHQGIFTLFPEGRTTDGREVRPFYSRLFAAAIDTGTDVVPVTLRYHIDGGHDPIAPYTDNQSITQSLRGLITRDHTEVNVVFGQPIPFDGYTRKEIAALARNAVLAALHGPEQIPLAQRIPM